MAGYKPFTSYVLPINMAIAPYGDNLNYPFEYDYSWVFYTACVVCFLAAMGIGANDVANAFATSVGSKSLTYVQALFIAAVFEFLGALLLGGAVTSTIKDGLVNPKSFVTLGDQDLLMMGMFCALISTTSWLALATFLEMPVSTTHSIIGAILGFALCIPQHDVDWSVISKVVASWFLSPLLASVCSATFFAINRSLILRSKDSFKRSLIAFPFLVFFVVTINIFFIILKGGKALGWDKAVGGTGPALGIAAACGAGMAILCAIFILPYMRKTLENAVDPDLIQAKTEVEEASNGDVELSIQDQGAATEASGGEEKKSAVSSMMNAKQKSIHEITNDNVQMVHDNAEKFEYRTELSYGFLQVFTACSVSFAHGANDVANAIGPLAAITAVYDSNGYNLSSKSATPTWILALGGVGIVVGLFVYGHKLIRALGVKLIKITPSRGTCIELATSLVIIVGTILKLPLSTTHTMVGASLGVGLVEMGSKYYSGERGDDAKTINTRLMLKTFFGWIITVVITALSSALLFSFAVYGPSVIRPISPQNCLYAYGSVAGSALTIPQNASYLAAMPSFPVSFPEDFIQVV